MKFEIKENITVKLSFVALNHRVRVRLPYRESAIAELKSYINW